MQQQVVENDKLSALHQRVYQKHGDAIGKRIAHEFQNFLTTFVLSPDDPNYEAYADHEDDANIFYYVREADKLKAEELKTLYVDFSHLSSYNWEDPQFMDRLQGEYVRYEPYLRQGLTNFLSNQGHLICDQKWFQVGIYNLPGVQKIRDLKTFNLGKIMSISGTVTRTTEVKPELQIGSFRCVQCNQMNKGVEQQYKFTEPQRCESDRCFSKEFELSTSSAGSVYLDWQKLRLQELSADIPAGSMPRSIDVITRGDTVDRAKPGDRAIFSGTLVVVPDIVQLMKPGEKQQSTNVDNSRLQRNDQFGRTMDGFAGLNRTGVKDLSFKMVFMANSVMASDERFATQKANTGADEEANEEENLNKFSKQEQQQVLLMKDQADLYTKLARSVAPGVYGHLDVKKGILLQLFGGIKKYTQEGIQLRGDINICIVGDPATAKSQFLKYICQFLPRSIYCSGKASNAAGLTASVRKDPETGEFCIEAGALMLADHGICCIDEFDKMDIKDQTAIHEAMEQQTISIAKAGIHATLNARTSILAAANPLRGRYDRTKSLRYNVDISPPIMSRFDLFFIIKDEKKDEEDFHIARHIVQMHRLQDGALNPDFSMSELQTYIKVCRTLKPQFTKESAEILRDEYKKLRQQSSNKQAGAQSSYRYTVRQLESLIRLSEAMARAHAETVIRPVYVKEVCRLLKDSNVSILKSDLEFEENQEQMNQESTARQQMEMQQAPTQANNSNDLFTMEADAQRMSQAANQANMPAQQTQATDKKVKITYEDYQRISLIIASELKQAEVNGEESLQQSDIVNKVINKIVLNEGAGTSIEKAAETAKKITNCINHMITKENVLMITQDSKVKNERLLCLNIAFDVNNIN